MNQFHQSVVFRQSLDNCKRTIQIAVLWSLILIMGLSGNILFTFKWLGEWLLTEETSARIFTSTYGRIAEKISPFHL